MRLLLMGRSQRVPSSFARWIVPGNDATLSTTRAAVLEELHVAVQQHRFDSETLESITLILRHECLCWKYESDKTLLPGQDSGAFCATLKISEADQLVEDLSSCLVRSIDPSSHYVRELQSKALLSALALLHAQGVSALQAAFYDAMRVRLAARFEDMQYVPDQKAIFSVETVRRVQSAYYLCLGAEYAKNFRKAEPVVVSVVSRMVSLLIVGASITSNATGSGLPNLQTTLKGLEKAFKPFWVSTNELFQGLCRLQELTTITTALHAYGKAMADTDNMVYEKCQECSTTLATVIIDHILSLLNSRKGFQIHVGPKSVYLDYFVAYFNRGPNDLGRYFYQYGLLDCLSQLSGVLCSEELSVNLSDTLHKIIATSQEASYRWKCAEILMRDSVTRGTQRRKIPDAAAERNPNMTKQAKSQLQMETNVIFELLNEEEGISLTPETWVAGSQDTAAEGQLSPSEWIESRQPSSPSFSEMGRPQKSPISLRATCDNAGLSPDGMHAYFVGKRDLYLYRLPTSTGAQSNDMVLHLNTTKSKPKSEYSEAVLSNSFLAVLKESRTYSLEIYKYTSHVQTYLPAIETFEATSNEPLWKADCLAIQEARDRVWVAVGGRSSLGHTISSTIRMYRIDIDGKNFSKHDAYFHRSKPNPFSSDYIKSIAFAADGWRLICVTNNNRILVWQLSNNVRPIQPPFEIAKKYTPEMNARGATSVTLFQTASLNPYVLCTTSPSKERARNNCEFSFVSPVGAGPARVPPQLDHSLSRLRKAGAIIAGAVSPDGSVIALLVETGKILLMPLEAQEGGGLSSRDPINLDAKLGERKRASTTALRFCEVDHHLCLVAVDPKGTVIRQYFQDRIST